MPRLLAEGVNPAAPVTAIVPSIHIKPVGLPVVSIEPAVRVPAVRVTCPLVMSSRFVTASCFVEVSVRSPSVLVAKPTGPVIASVPPDQAKPDGLAANIERGRSERSSAEEGDAGDGIQFNGPGSSQLATGNGKAGCLPENRDRYCSPMLSRRRGCRCQQSRANSRCEDRLRL